LAPDFRRIAFAADERVVARHTAIAIEAQDLADMVIGLLRQLALVAVPAGYEEITILVDRHGPAVAPQLRPLAAPAARYVAARRTTAKRRTSPPRRSADSRRPTWRASPPAPNSPAASGCRLHPGATCCS